MEKELTDEEIRQYHLRLLNHFQDAYERRIDLGKFERKVREIEDELTDKGIDLVEDPKYEAICKCTSFVWDFHDPDEIEALQEDNTCLEEYVMWLKKKLKAK